MLLLKLNRMAEAAEQFRTVLGYRKRHQLAYLGLAQALWKLGDFDDAEAEFQMASQCARDNHKPQKIVFTSQGWFYVDRKRWRDAMAAFEKARDEDPSYFGNYWGIGHALMGLGDYNGAVASLQRALEEPSLQPAASVEIPELLAECLRKRSEANDAGNSPAH